MATNFKEIVEAIKAVLDDQSTKMAIAYSYERSTFDEFPAIVIAKSDNEADWGTTELDKLNFVFKLRCYYPVPDEGEHADAEIALTEVIDELLTIFRPKDVLGAACDWVRPAPSIWFYEIRSEAVYRVAEITLNCTKYVS